MLKADYFKLAIEKEAFRYKAWVLHCFSMTRFPESETFPLQLSKGVKHYYFIAEDLNEQITLEDTDVTKPPFHFRETISLKEKELPNLSKDVTVTYGQLLANVIALVYPLKDKIPFQEGEFNIQVVEDEIVKRLTTDPEYQDKKSFKHANPIYVSEYLKFIDCILSLEGFSQLCVPSATEKTMTRDPRIPELRKQLLEKYKDQLNDPAVVAKIDAELIAMDKEWVKGDLAEGFFKSSKSYDVVRKKTFLMQGYEGGLGDNYDTIESSLSEGWDVEKMPAIVNALREGSYSRGKMTALGGAATKTVNRMFQNTRVTQEDCGTTLGWVRTVTKELVGFYLLEKGKTILLDENNINGYLGKEHTVRSPQFCKASGNKFCKYCIGEPNAENENAIGAHAAAMTSQLMNIMMKKMHGVSLNTEEYEIVNTIK